MKKFIDFNQKKYRKMEIKYDEYSDLSVETHGWIKMSQMVAEAIDYIKEHQLGADGFSFGDVLISTTDYTTIELGEFVVSDGEQISRQIARIGVKVSTTEGRREIVIYGINFEEAKYVMSVHAPKESE